MTYDELIQRKRERLFGTRFPDTSARGIEFGPLSRPLVRKSDSDVYYIDQCSTEELKAKYSQVNDAHVHNIVDVDFVSKGEPLSVLVGDKVPLNYVVASHVIEHVPDLAGWLLDAHASLKDGGSLFLILPDKRFTFDLRRPVAKFEEVELARAEKRTRPGLRLILDHFANVVQADTWALWADYSLSERVPYFHGAEFLDIAYAHFYEGRYVDVHCWVFTPWSFMSIMGEITSHFNLGFRLNHFLTTQLNDLEFYVELQKSDRATDWVAEAAAALKGALWPKDSRVTVAPLAARYG